MTSKRQQQHRHHHPHPHNHRSKEKYIREEVIINPLHSVFDNSESTTTKETSLDEWLSIFPQAALFTGYDDVLFEQIITMVYRNPKTEKICTKSITKFGISSYDNMRLNHSSRFWPACENLLLKYQKSNVRRSLAISNLKNSNKLLNHAGNLGDIPSWDETNAGDLANQMTLMQGKSPEEIGKKLLQLGVLQQHHLGSYGMDVVYNNSSSSSQEIIDDNNRLVSLLGEQLDHLFDPLLEYSPEKMSFVYTAPQVVTKPRIRQTKLMQSIIDELVSVQANFTWKLTELLQNFIVPLRASVLSSHESASGIAKVNQIFPPTIDEITRINRILSEALLTAKSINYVEVMKAVGNILPYFYKPFVRHEANLKNFYERLSKFASKNRKHVFENGNINKDEYSIREIDGIITGSLMELPRLKLILQRLFETIKAEELKAQNFEYIESDGAEIQMYYDSAIQVIDAFGAQEEDDDETNEQQLKQRIFTPTGKILTELATNWPAELQYGWLSRKVVGIFELHNVKTESTHALDVLIIFSDHLLFLTIVDNQQYLEEEHSDGVIKKISVSDALMHSLVNEKPLPNLQSFPAMEVNAWCNIEDVVASGYTAVDDNDQKTEYIRFLNTVPSGFKSLTSKKHFTRNYRLEQCKSSNIIDLINKARLLYKSSPFHLFKSTDNNLKVYYTAHDYAVYEKEISQSQFVLFLNMKIDVPEYFRRCPHLQLVLQASFIDDKKIQITGFERSSKKQLNEFVSVDELQGFLQTTVGESFKNIFQTYNNVTKNLVQSNASDLIYVANGCTTRDDIKLLNKVEYKPQKPHHLPQLNFAHRSTPSEPIIIPEAYMEKVEPPPPPKLEIEVNDIAKSQMRKRKSICDLFKKKEESTPLVISHPVPQEESRIPRNVSQTFIPKGHENEYINTLRPIPTLHQIALSQQQQQQQQQQSTSASASASASSALPESKRYITPQSIVHHQTIQEQESPDEKGTTDTSTPSIDVLPDFRFPQTKATTKDPIPVQEIEFAPKVAPTIKRIETIDSNRIHLKRKSSNFKAENYKSLPIGIVESPSDISPNWEAISASRNSSLRTSNYSNERRLSESSNLRFQLKASSKSYEPDNDEEVATRVIDIASLRQNHNHGQNHYHVLSRSTTGRYSTPVSQARSYSAGSRTVPSSTFSVKRTSTNVTTPVTRQSLVLGSKKSPYVTDRFFNTNATAAIFVAPRAPTQGVPREDSMISLSPSEVADELAKFIDDEFGIDSENNPIEYHKNISAITLTTDDYDEEGEGEGEEEGEGEGEEEEEIFYSPNEEPNLVRNISQSESSEATVTSNRYIMMTRTESSNKSVSLREDSEAQLSAYLERTVNF